MVEKVDLTRIDWRWFDIGGAQSKTPWLLPTQMDPMAGKLYGITNHIHAVNGGMGYDKSRNFGIAFTGNRLVFMSRWVPSTLLTDDDKQELVKSYKGEPNRITGSDKNELEKRYQETNWNSGRHSWHPSRSEITTDLLSGFLNHDQVGRPMWRECGFISAPLTNAVRQGRLDVGDIPVPIVTRVEARESFLKYIAPRFTGYHTETAKVYHADIVPAIVEYKPLREIVPEGMLNELEKTIRDGKKIYLVGDFDKKDSWIQHHSTIRAAEEEVKPLPGNGTPSGQERQDSGGNGQSSPQRGSSSQSSGEGRSRRKRKDGRESRNTDGHGAGRRNTSSRENQPMSDSQKEGWLAALLGVVTVGTAYGMGWVHKTGKDTQYDMYPPEPQRPKSKMLTVVKATVAIGAVITGGMLLDATLFKGKGFSKVFHK